MNCLRSASSALLTVLFALLAMPLAATAHEGHEHGETPTPAAEVAAPRLALHTAHLELVAVRGGAGLLIYVDDYDSNAPLAGLDLRVQGGDRALLAQADGDGVYRIPAGLLNAGAQPLRFVVHGDGLDETLQGVLPAAAVAAPAAANDSAGPGPGLAVALAAAIALALAAWRLRRRRARA